MQTPLSDREMHVASWTAELALEMIESALLRQWEAEMQAALDQPWWAWRRRRELESRSQALLGMFTEIGKYRKEQRDAWVEAHGR